MLSVCSYTADLLHHRPAVLCNQTYITVSMLCNYRRDRYHTQPADTALQKDVLFTVCVFLLVTEEFLTEQSRPRCRKQKQKNMDREIVMREGVKRICFLSVPAPLSLPWMVCLSLSLCYKLGITFRRPSSLVQYPHF